MKLTFVDIYRSNVAVACGGAADTLSFVAVSTQDEAPVRMTTLPFRAWWNRDVIYRGGERPPHAVPGESLAAGAAIPFERRPTLTRRQLVDLVRNKFGAHISPEIPELLEALQRSEIFGVDIRIADGDRTRSISNGGLVTEVGPASGMIRQIAEELLIAYGRRPLRPRFGRPIGPERN